MKHLLLIFSLLTFSFGYVIATENTAIKTDKNITATRTPSAAYAKSTKLADLSRQNSLTKYIDPENGTICYVATGYDGESSPAMQCFEKR